MIYLRSTRWNICAFSIIGVILCKKVALNMGQAIMWLSVDIWSEPHRMITNYLIFRCYHLIRWDRDTHAHTHTYMSVNMARPPSIKITRWCPFAPGHYLSQILAYCLLDRWEYIALKFVLIHDNFFILKMDLKNVVIKNIGHISQHQFNNNIFLLPSTLPLPLRSMERCVKPVVSLVATNVGICRHQDWPRD